MSRTVQVFRGQRAIKMACGEIPHRKEDPNYELLGTKDGQQWRSNGTKRQLAGTKRSWINQGVGNITLNHRELIDGEWHSIPAEEKRKCA